MQDWIIGVLMGFWLALVLVASVCVMRSNRLTQDACARVSASLERVQASNSRVEAAYASWRSEAILTGRRVTDVDDERAFWSSIDKMVGPPDSATGTTS